MEVTQEMLEAAMKEAVKQKLVRKTVSLDEYERVWEAMREVLRAALATTE